MKTPQLNQKSAFTLIEILVVITIIGLLVAVGATSFIVVTKQSRDAKRKADLEQLKGALETYRSTTNSYPTTSGSWYGSCAGIVDYIPGLVSSGYISKLPTDPKEGQPNTTFTNCTNSTAACYFYKSDGNDYKLRAKCTPEFSVQPTDPYYDPALLNTDNTTSYAFQVSSSNTARAWGD